MAFQSTAQILCACAFVWYYEIAWSRVRFFVQSRSGYHLQYLSDLRHLHATLLCLPHRFALELPLCCLRLGFEILRAFLDLFELV
jgi:hypothetical protein